MSACTTFRHCLCSAQRTSAARTFFQIAATRAVHTSPLLDFLTPSGSTGGISSSGSNARSTSFCHSVTSQNPCLVRKVRLQPAQSRGLRTSSRRFATATIHNAKQDDDGQPMSVEITARAAQRLREIMDKDANPRLALRITVESGGCHGFQYLMSLTTLPPTSDLSSESASTREAGLQEARTEAMHAQANTPAFKNTTPKVVELDEDDTVFESLDGNHAKVVMDGPSLELLKGSKIDYTMELIGSQFKIVDNPLATSSCGCGTSFDIKA